MYRPNPGCRVDNKDPKNENIMRTKLPPLNCIKLRYVTLDWIELNWIELNWIALNWIELNWIE